MKGGNLVRVQPQSGIPPRKNWLLFHLLLHPLHRIHFPGPTNTPLLKLKWLSWQTKMHIIWGHILPLLKNKWDDWSVLWHLLEIMFIIFMNMEMRGQLPESLTPRTCALFALSENFFPCRFKIFTKQKNNNNNNKKQCMVSEGKWKTCLAQALHSYKLC